MHKVSKYTTKQAEIILNFFKEKPLNHYTADDICFALREKGISRATVYRRLEQFVENGEIRKYILGKGKSACYQICNDCGDNCYHFVCSECNTVLHVKCEMLNGIKNHFDTDHQFVIDNAKTVFYGICKECRKEEGKQNG